MATMALIISGAMRRTMVVSTGVSGLQVSMISTAITDLAMILDEEDSPAAEISADSMETFADMEAMPMAVMELPMVDHMAGEADTADESYESYGVPG